MTPQKIDAVLSLVPNAEVVVRGSDSTAEVEWINPSEAPITNEQIDDELIRLQNIYLSNEYQRKRASEYPDFKDYLDGIVKGDQAQIDAYIASCQAVKAKYPK